MIYVLLTALSGGALWLLLLVLVGLLGPIAYWIVKIRTSLSKISMGVRAIEQQTALLPAILPPFEQGIIAILQEARQAHEALALRATRKEHPGNVL